MDIVAFLVDITEHLNILNLKLQGKKRTICGLMSDFNSFGRKVEMFIGDISDSKLFFSKLKAYEAEHPNSKVDHIPFLDGLKENFYMRFEDFRLVRLCWRDW